MIKYENIPSILSKYSFSSKMSISQKYSKVYMKSSSFDTMMQGDLIYPWHLEVFALMAIIPKVEGNGKITNEGSKHNFIEIIKSITYYKHPKYDGMDSDGFIVNFFSLESITQFKYYENIWFKLYRYNYIYTFKNENVDMVDIFKSKFECEYNEFLIFYTLFYNLFNTDNSEIKHTDLNKIFFSFPAPVNSLVIAKDDFVKKQIKQLPNGISDYYYAFKYFYQFPFIQHESIIHLPLPHVLTDSVSSSLLYRITEGKDTLRDKIGKNVIEMYLFTILEQSRIYDELKLEEEYNIGKLRRIDTPDVMVCKDNICILFDCKISVPSTELLRFNGKKKNEIIDDCAGYVKRTYDRVCEFGKYYNPFNIKKEFSRNNIFGVVILLEDHYIQRELIYKRVSGILDIPYDSDEMAFIMSNVKLVGMRDIEECTFYSVNYSDVLVKQRDDSSKWCDFAFRQLYEIEGDGVVYNHTIMNFKKSIINSAIRKLHDIDKYNF